MTIALHITCHVLPDPAQFPGLLLALQDKTGMVGAAPITADVIYFDTLLTVKPGSPPDFSGPAVHGPKGERFLYLAFGRQPGAAWEPMQRAKLPLAAVPPALLEQAVASGAPLRVAVRMTQPNGRPVAATLKPEYYTWESGRE